VNFKHGHTKGHDKTTLYSIWANLKQRCSDPGATSWQYYGAKGVQVTWANFDEFLRDMQDGWKPGLSIGRRDNNGPYSKENCRWETSKEQTRNYSRNVFLEFNGKRMVAADWADFLKMNRMTLYRRLWAGWPVEEALTTPVATRCRK